MGEREGEQRKSMTRATERLRSTLGLDDPFAEPPLEDLPEDLQGWAGTDPLLRRAIEAIRPGLVIEVGTRKGQSAVFMAETCRELGLDAALLCIDTWLGSLEHLLDPGFRPLFAIRRGRPTLYEQFLSNIRARGLQTYVTPLPQTSRTAARFLGVRGVRADLVYLDASHEEEDVLADLEAYWPLLRPGGLSVGDDCIAAFPGVVRACVAFARRVGIQPWVEGVKFVLRKPGSAGDDSRPCPRTEAVA